LVGKREGRRQLGRCRCRREGNIRTNLREIGWEGVDWMYVVQNRDQWLVLMDSVMNLWVP